MSFNRNKWLTIGFLVLVAMNIATLGAFWILKDKKSGPPAGMRNGVTEFLIKELQLDSAQQLRFRELVAEHRQGMNDIRKDNRQAKDSFFELLKQPNIDEASLAKAAAAANLPDQRMEMITFRHFQQLRAICNETQKAKFDEIIHEVLRMNAPGNQPPPPPPGARGHFPPDGPPPGE
jgi:protein CpxP